MRLWLLILPFVLSSCGSITGDTGLVVRSLLDSFQNPTLPTFETGLSPNYRYLAVKPTTSGAALLVLGFESTTAFGHREVWYSRDGVALETVNGRISNVEGYPHAWSSVVWAPTSGHTVRTRDVLGTYQFSVTDVLTPSSLPFAHVPEHVWRAWESPANHWSGLSWSTDAIATQPPNLSPGNAWFAHGAHRGMNDTVVASFQCMRPDYCFHTARWPL